MVTFDSTVFSYLKGTLFFHFPEKREFGHMRCQDSGVINT